MDAEFARQSRERCQPVECTGAPECWVALGTAAALGVSKPGTPRCAACGGIIRQRNWRGLGLERVKAAE